jgi:hypothetical protein
MPIGAQIQIITGSIPCCPTGPQKRPRCRVMTCFPTLDTKPNRCMLPMYFVRGKYNDVGQYQVVEHEEEKREGNNGERGPGGYKAGRKRRCRKVARAGVLDVTWRGPNDSIQPNNRRMQDIGKHLLSLWNMGNHNPPILRWDVNFPFSNISKNHF